MKKKCCRIIAICLALIIIKNEFTPFLLQKATYGMPALIAKGKIENLYIGSSMFRQGLDIYTLEEMEEESYILAYNGNQPVLEYKQLEYLVKNGVEIKNLYVDMYVYSAWSEPKIQDEKYFMEIGLEHKIDLWRIISKQENIKFLDFWRMFVGSNNELLLTWPINKYLINSQFYKGGAKVQPVGTSEEKLKELSVPLVEGNMNVEQKNNIKAIIELCKKNEIQLYFVETPKYQKVAEDELYLSAMQEYTSFLTEQDVLTILCANTYENIKNGENIEFYEFDNNCADYFTDLIHLSYSGRIALSQELKSLLEAHE